MSLVYWLPMVSDTLENQGLSNAVPINHDTTIGDGKLGKCRNFSGTAQYIDTGYKESFGTGDFTISVWAKLNQTSGKSYQPIISNKTTGAVSVGFAIYYNQSQNKFLWSTADGSASTEIWTANTFSASTINGKWMHIVMVRNSSDSKKGYFYIDGERQELAYIPAIRNITNTTYNIMIGDIADHSHSGYIWTGSICDVRIYDHALSPREIKEISKGLVLHYPLSQPGASNMALNSNDLTLWNKESGMTCVWDDTQQMFKIDTTTRTSSRWGIYQDVTCEPNTIYTFSVDGKKVEKTMYLSIGSFASGSVTWPSNHQQFTNNRQRLSYTFTTGDNHTIIRIYLAVYPTSEGSNAAYYAFPKLEKSDHATPWIPNSADIDYAKLGLNDNIIYDVSGYQNNGEIYKYDSNGSIECVSDTPKYILSTHINSLNPNTSAASGTVFLYGHCSITNPNQLTMAFWCKPIQGYGGNTGQGQFATTNYNIGESTAVDYLNSAMNHRDSIIDINSADGNTHIRPSIGFTANEWHHYAITYDGQIAIVYKDGIESSRKSFDTPTLLGSFIGVSIGFSKAGGVWRRNNSYYSDFRVYTTALSADDILELYHAPISITNSGILMTQGELWEV